MRHPMGLLGLSGVVALGQSVQWHAIGNGQRVNPCDQFQVMFVGSLFVSGATDGVLDQDGFLSEHGY